MFIHHLYILSFENVYFSTEIFQFCFVLFTGCWVGRGFPRPDRKVSLGGGRGVISPCGQRDYLACWAIWVGISLAGAACLGISQYLLGEERNLRLGEEG